MDSVHIASQLDTDVGQNQHTKMRGKGLPFLHMDVCLMMKVEMSHCYILGTHSVACFSFCIAARVHLPVDAQSKVLSVVATCSLKCWQMTIVEFYMKDVLWKPVIFRAQHSVYFGKYSYMLN